MNATEVSEIFASELLKIEDVRLRERVSSVSIEPCVETRAWSGALAREECRVWIVIRIPNSDIVVGYTREAFGRNGFTWGLMLLDDDWIGDASCWYRTLRDCVSDASYFEDWIWPNHQPS